MSSTVEIANVALRFIGASRITSFDDGTKNADVISDLFDETRDLLLASHFWNFATKRVELAQSDTDPVFGFQHKYAIPADWIRTVSVHDTSDGFGTVDFKSEAGFIALDANQAWMRYIYRAEDPNLMTANFRRALSSALARDLALPIADSGTMRDRLDKQAQADLAYAKSKDAMEGTPDARPLGSWVSGRFGSRRTWPW